MSKVVSRLSNLGLIKPPAFVVGGTQYETITGSMAYGVSSDSSDMDVYGFCIPPKDLVFPHLAGEVPGFGQQIQRFEQFSQHAIVDKEASKKYDVTIFSIVKFFQLCMENNPNMIDCLFTAPNMVLHQTKIAEMVRMERKSFLHKGSWHKFKGYAFSELNKIKNKKPHPSSARYELVQKFGYDVKHAYHVIRLLNEVEMILTECDLDLMRSSEELKSIRRGEWSLKDIEDRFRIKEKELEVVYSSSKLPYSPDESRIKALLLSCLEEHYGSLKDCVSSLDRSEQALRDIKEVMRKYGV